jgi:hypothetical protein
VLEKSAGLSVTGWLPCGSGTGAALVANPPGAGVVAGAGGVLEQAETASAASEMMSFLILATLGAGHETAVRGVSHRDLIRAPYGRGMRKRWWIATAGAAAAAALAAGGVAVAQGISDDDQPVTGADADRATAAALTAAGGGRANSVEYDTEDGATYEVEVTRPDGTTVDVRLDGAFKVVVIEADSEESGADTRR